MKEIQLGIAEAKFADMIWQNEPLTASQLSKLSKESLGWAKTTSYTVLKRLCEKGLFKKEGGFVRSLVSKDEFCYLKSRKFINDEFEGSLPAFIAAFTSGEQLSEKEVLELKALLDSMEK